MNKTIVLTGGGSAGHVSGNLALIPKLLEEGWHIHYVGSEQGIERKLIAAYKEITYHPISTGKLRRYCSWENVTDVFRVVSGVFQSYKLIKKLKPRVVFSKGGFVAVPVVIGAKLHNVPIVIFEPDLNMGLSNKISYPFATTMCTAFRDAATNARYPKSIYTGPILRDDLHSDYTEQALSFYGFSSDKPILLIMGGSLGSQSLNQMVTTARNELLSTFQIVHICGKGKVEHTLSMPGYRPFEYVGAELTDLLAMADVVVSRAGSSAIMELLALHKPMLLIPHINGGSRSGQLANAEYFKQAGFADMLLQEQWTTQSFIKAILQLYENRAIYTDNMKNHVHRAGADEVMKLISHAAGLELSMDNTGLT